MSDLTLETKIKLRDNSKCSRCHSRKNLTIHHLKPREIGGTDDERNLVTLCHKCHNWVEANDPTWDEIKKRAPVYDPTQCCNRQEYRSEFGLVFKHEEHCRRV